MGSGTLTEQIDAVLPAGGRISGAFAQAAGVEIKALIPLEGRTLLCRVIEALRATGRIGRIVVVGPEEALAEAQAYGADAALLEGATGPENIYRGLEWLRAQESGPPSRVLIMTTDLPFITPEAINAFLDSCPSDADIAIPIVTREAFEGRFPGTESVYTHLRDGAFTLGCAFLVSLETVLRCRPQVEDVFRARKSQWQMARLVGGRILFRFVTRRLTVPDIVERAGRLLACRGEAIRNAPAELAYDIDLPADYAYACDAAATLPATNARKEAAP